jgi:hypothetical protein
MLLLRVQTQPLSRAKASQHVDSHRKVLGFIGAQTGQQVLAITCHGFKFVWCGSCLAKEAPIRLHHAPVTLTSLLQTLQLPCAVQRKQCGKLDCRHPSSTREPRELSPLQLQQDDAGQVATRRCRPAAAAAGRTVPG